jgi:catechol 2,3-dioxygenase-like lactoylglutathione lyase family enzyme
MRGPLRKYPGLAHLGVHSELREPRQTRPRPRPGVRVRTPASSTSLRSPTSRPVVEPPSAIRRTLSPFLNPGKSRKSAVARDASARHRPIGGAGPSAPGASARTTESCRTEARDGRTPLTISPAGCDLHRSRKGMTRSSSRTPGAGRTPAYTVTGIGGVLLRARNAEKLQQWYARHLGLRLDEYGGVTFRGNSKPSERVAGSTTWAIFPQHTPYFGRRTQAAMVNCRVKNLDALLRHMRRARVRVDPHPEAAPNGRFAWAYGPEGNRFELWDPKEPPRARRPGLA